jgi:hypothetical protein
MDMATIHKTSKKEAPVPIVLLSSYFKAMSGTASTKEWKQHAKVLLDDLEKGYRDAAERKKQAMLDNKGDSEIKAITAEYNYLLGIYTFSFAQLQSLDSLQTRWHMKMNRIEADLENRKKNAIVDHVAENLHLYTPTAIVLTSWQSKAWISLIQIAQEVWKQGHNLTDPLFHETAKLADNIVEGGMYIGGFVALILSGMAIKWGVNKWKYQMDKRGEKKDDVYFNEEGKVLKAMTESLKNYAIGLSAQFGFIKSIEDTGDQEILKLAKNKDIAGVWKVVAKRFEKTKEGLPEQIWGFFGIPLQLTENVSDQHNGTEQTKN